MKTIDKYRAFCKKYNTDMIYMTRYKRHIRWISDEDSYNNAPTMSNHKANPNSLHQKYLKWKEETWDARWYDWYRRRIQKGQNLDEYTISIT